MEWAWTLFAFGTFWFWGLLALETIVLLTCIEYEHGTFSTLSVVAFFTLLYFFGGFNALQYGYQNPLKVLMYFGGYLGLGVLWSIGKWWSYTSRQREHYDEAREKFLEERGNNGGMTDELRYEWEDYVEKYRIEYKPKARNHKKRLVMWATYWPWSLAWTLLDDVVKRFLNFAIRKLQRVYQAISDYSFRGTEADFLDQARKNAIREQVAQRKAQESQQREQEEARRRGSRW